MLPRCSKCGLRTALDGNGKMPVHGSPGPLTHMTGCPGSGQDPLPEAPACEHHNFECDCTVNRLENQQNGPMRFSLDVKVSCVECGTPFRFIGLPAGLDLNGAAVSADGTEARLAILPKGQVLTVIDGAPAGFTVRKNKAVREVPSCHIPCPTESCCPLCDPEQFDKVPLPAAIDRAMCMGCGKRTTSAIPLLGWKTDDGFDVTFPTCGHGKYLTCPACREKFIGCPVCGCQEEYT